MIIDVLAKPSSDKQEIIADGQNKFVIRLKSHAEGNKANIELIKLLAKYFNTAQKNILIIRGMKSKNKIVEIK